MNKARCNETDYINFLVATPRNYSCVEAGKVQPERVRMPGHDAFTRLLTRLEPDATALWHEAQTQVNLRSGVLLIDDSTLDKPYARQIELVSRHWSGKHHAVVQGINLVTLLWTDGERHIPCDYRLYAKEQDGLSKNDHFRHMLTTAQQRGFAPECVLFDSWYASLNNLKLVRDFGWRWLTRLKSNRLVNPDGSGLRPLPQVELAATGTVVHLKGYGLVKVFRLVAPDGDIEYWATNDVDMHELQRLHLAEFTWTIESYHRGIKQCCGIEKAQVRSATAQRNHIGLALRAFLRLERFSFVTGISWYEAKTAIIRRAVAAYLAQPLYSLTFSASTA
jgi:putative transposase